MSLNERCARRHFALHCKKCNSLHSSIFSSFSFSNCSLGECEYLHAYFHLKIIIETEQTANGKIGAAALYTRAAAQVPQHTVDMTNEICKLFKRMADRLISIHLLSLDFVCFRN